MKGFINVDTVNKNLDVKLDGLSSRIESTRAELKTHKSYVEKELPNMRKQLHQHPVPVPQKPAASPLKQKKEKGDRERKTT